MPLSNIFSNKLDDLINISNKEDVISRCHQTRNMTSLQLPGIRRNRVANHYEMEEKAIGKNGVTRYSKRGEEIEDINENISKISFID